MSRNARGAALGPHEERPAAPSVGEGDGRTALHDAALDDDSEALLGLLAGGAEVDATDVDGAAALHCAAHNGALGALQVLLAAHPVVDAADRNGNTALMIAVTTSNGDTSLVVHLLEAGADPWQANHHGRCPAEMARLLGHSDLDEMFRALRGAT